MAAVCPKCNEKLTIFNVSANCPHCGVNLLYYDIEKRLMADADKAELEHAAFSKKTARVKASFVGSRLAIARIVMTVLPIGALMLPLAQVKVNAPYISENFSVNAIKIYEKISALDFGMIFKFFDSSILGNAFTYYFASIISIVFVALSALLSLIFLAFSSSPRGKSRNYILACIGIVFSGVATFSFAQYGKLMEGVFPEAVTMNISFGAFVLIFAFILSLAINIMVNKKGVEIKYKECFIDSIPEDIYKAALENGDNIDELRVKYRAIKAENDAVEAAKKEEEEKAKAEAEAEKAKTK